MNVLIVGLGSIARKHIHVLKELRPDVSIYALRSSRNSMDLPQVHNLYDWPALLNINFHFAIVANPSSLHLEYIRRLSAMNIPLMIEKPLVTTMAQISEFQKLELRNNLMYVACNMRFHPLIEFIKDYLVQVPRKINEVNVYFGSYLPAWRPDSDYRKIYSAKKELGGGVHLDLIHEPDYVVYLFGMPLASRNSKMKVSELAINSYDTSNTLLQYHDFHAQVVVNYFRRDPSRICEIIRDEDTLRIDFINNEIRDSTRDKTLFRLAQTSVYTTYRRQMEYFLECIDLNKVSMNTPAEAIEILKLVI
jgi:predicted dehydrogenase